MESFDVIIVGGGPAGSTCARSLAETGMNVAVLDKARFPRDKVCAGWITPQVVQTLHLDLNDYAHGRTLQPITAFVTGLGTDAARNVVYDREVSYGIRRSEFDHYLLQRSKATLKLGEPLQTIARENNAWTINDSFRAPLLIGAGGHFCPIAQHLGASVGRGEPAITAQEIEFELDARQQSECKVSAHTPELYFCADLKGYAWCFRKGNFLNVGLGRDENHRLAEQLKAFWDWLVAQGKVPADMHPRFKGHAYLLRTRSLRSIVTDGALLIGDAVGLAYPESGEGIRPAIESGILAAQTIVAARGDYSKARLKSYEDALQVRFGARETSSRSFIPANFKTAIARSLMKTEWFARNVVLNRWFLHAQQPALV